MSRRHTGKTGVFDMDPKLKNRIDNMLEQSTNATTAIYALIEAGLDREHASEEVREAVLSTKLPAHSELVKRDVYDLFRTHLLESSSACAAVSTAASHNVSSAIACSDNSTASAFARGGASGGQMDTTLDYEESGTPRQSKGDMLDDSGMSLGRVASSKKFSPGFNPGLTSTPTRPTEPGTPGAPAAKRPSIADWMKSVTSSPKAVAMDGIRALSQGLSLVEAESSTSAGSFESVCSLLKTVPRTSAGLHEDSITAVRFEMMASSCFLLFHIFIFLTVSLKSRHDNRLI